MCPLRNGAIAPAPRSRRPRPNHDDALFGANYTTRGNPTEVQRWVNGSSYLTTKLSYDTTGNIVQETDPAGNVTKFRYTDAFYSDNGANPPQGQRKHFMHAVKGSLFIAFFGSDVVM